MANNPISTATTLFVVLVSLFVAGNSQTFSTNLPPTSLRLGRQKLTHLHFFVHDMVGGPNPTSIRVAAAPIADISPSGFGFVAINDNLLTIGPELNSTSVGRAQGMYAGADLNEKSFTMVQNIVFDEERLNGSTLSILGRNPISALVREFPVVGGSGVFRFASGHVNVKTHSSNATNGDYIFEYDAYVLHY